MGEGEGGGGQKSNLVPPPLHPLPPKGGEIFLGRICLINYGLLSNLKFERLTGSLWFCYENLNEGNEKELGG